MSAPVDIFQVSVKQFHHLPHERILHDARPVGAGYPAAQRPRLGRSRRIVRRRIFGMIVLRNLDREGLLVPLRHFCRRLRRAGHRRGVAFPGVPSRDLRLWQRRRTVAPLLRHRAHASAIRRGAGSGGVGLRRARVSRYRPLADWRLFFFRYRPRFPATRPAAARSGPTAASAPAAPCTRPSGPAPPR